MALVELQFIGYLISRFCGKLYPHKKFYYKKSNAVILIIVEDRMSSY
jgi:hypothetical protein